MQAQPFQPIIIASPAVRAGTTLVQRLLCSAPNGLIYGDVVGQEMDFLAKYAQARSHLLMHHDAIAAGQREALQAGRVDDFITSLAPAAAVQAQQWKKAALAWLQGCAEEAVSLARPVWGWKLAGPDGHGFANLAAWFPEARWIWIERDLGDCFRSAKAAGMVAGAAEALQFAQMAETSGALFSAMQPRQTLRLSYSAMILEPALTVERLERFTGVKGIDQSVFGRKINEPGARWTPPAELTAEEAAVFENFTHTPASAS